MCDVPLCDNPTPLEAFKEHSEIVVNSNDDSTSSDDDSPYVIDTFLPFSSENENKVVNNGILASEEKSPPSSFTSGIKASKLSSS
ncbi:hypothetical protein Tco_0816604 [Tanacetum coccineum]